MFLFFLVSKMENLHVNRFLIVFDNNDKTFPFLRTEEEGGNGRGKEGGIGWIQYF
jgi:hypothetical protein